jgi:hypothetical protein
MLQEALQMRLTVSCEREREKKKKVGGGSERHYIGGGGEETISPVLKVPRQCPLVLISANNKSPTFL